jgi:hypothetical protein
MSLNLEFIGFVPTPLEKYLGLASVRLNRMIVLRFKIVQKKDGSGIFPAVGGATKIPDASGDRYVNAFDLEMRSEEDAVKEFVLAEYKKWQQKEKPSIFNTSSTGQAMQQSESDLDLPF